MEFVKTHDDAIALIRNLFPGLEVNFAGDKLQNRLYYQLVTWRFGSPYVLTESHYYSLPLPKDKFVRNLRNFMIQFPGIN